MKIKLSEAEIIDKVIKQLDSEGKFPSTCKIKTCLEKIYDSNTEKQTVYLEIEVVE